MLIAPRVEAHTDYLNISIPYAESGGFQETVLEAIAPALPNACPGRSGLYAIGSIGKQEGSLKFVRRGEVFVVSLSGLALLFLRASECFSDFLWCFADRPHRVSHLDAALDVEGVEASPIVLDLYRLGLGSGVRLSQRRAPASGHFAMGLAGLETGTVYLGGRSARVRLAVYDKREEQVRKGRVDPGPKIRYELRFRGGEDGVPLTLRDASDPTALFWHYIPEVLLRPAPGLSVPEWVKSEVGYDLPPRLQRTPDEVLRKWVERVGLEGVALADRVGPRGRSLLAYLMGLGVTQDDASANI